MAGDPIAAVKTRFRTCGNDRKRSAGRGDRAGLDHHLSPDMRLGAAVCDLGQVVMPVLTPQAGTNFAAVRFRIAKKQIEDEIRGLARARFLQAGRLLHERR